MELNNFAYHSTHPEHQTLIGHSLTHSCTLLPTVEVINQLTFVDFPGFEDTNGLLISLGIEMALQALLYQHPSPIVVFESITNSESRYAAPAALGRRLDRLLANKQDCILGLTKYSRFSHFNAINSIEAKQREKLQNPSSEELTIQGQIKVLSQLPAEIKINLTELQENLKRLQEEREKQQSQPLAETEEKTRHRSEIQRTETELSQAIGLGSSILRLNDLSNPELRAACLETITSSTQAVQPHPEKKMDPSTQAFLDNRFKNDLLKKIQDDAESVEFDTPEALEKSIAEIGLIRTLLPSSQDNIKQFLSLPEMDPQILQTYDREIAEEFIKGCREAILHKLDVTLIETLPSTVVEEIQDFVFGEMGVPIDFPNPQARTQKWNSLRPYNYTPSSGAAALLPKIPRTIYAAYRWYQTPSTTPEAVDPSLANLITMVRGLKSGMQHLMRIRGLLRESQNSRAH